MASMAHTLRELKRRFTNDAAHQPFLAPADVQRACRRAGHAYRDCFWVPAVTILTFLRQIVHGNCSCRSAVQMTLAASAAGDAGLGPEGHGKVSGEPGAYSQARHQLPETVYQEISSSIRDRLGVQAADGRWCNREVCIVDGSSVSMPDEPELQAAFPQPVGQKYGCGFPVARLLAQFSWASGALMEVVIDSLKVGELTMYRRIFDRVPSAAVVLGDRHFGSYYDLAQLRARGLDGVFRLHQRRPRGFRSGTRLGPDDHLITWTKPKVLPRGIDAQEWSRIPATLTVRHVRRSVGAPGFRSRCVNVVTTLLDPQTYPAEKLVALYGDRWMVELNLRSMKTTLRMDVLKCKSVAMIRKELLMYQIAYNLVRTLMWQAAVRHEGDVRRLSFAGTQQRIAAMLPYLSLCGTAAQRQHLADRVLELIAEDILPDHSDGVEPRCVKRRPKNYQRLTMPRGEARKRCRRNPQAFSRRAAEA